MVVKIGSCLLKAIVLVWVPAKSKPWDKYLEEGHLFGRLILRRAEGVPGLPGAPQDDAGLTRKFEMSHVGGATCRMTPISGSLSCGAREVRSPCAWREGARPGSRVTGGD